MLHVLGTEHMPAARCARWDAVISRRLSRGGWQVPTCRIGRQVGAPIPYVQNVQGHIAPDKTIEAHTSASAARTCWAISSCLQRL
jgi:hypothetical protein